MTHARPDESRTVKASDVTAGMRLARHLPPIAGVRTNYCEPVVRAAVSILGQVYVIWIDGTIGQYHPDNEVTVVVDSTNLIDPDPAVEAGRWGTALREIDTCVEAWLDDETVSRRRVAEATRQMFDAWVRSVEVGRWSTALRDIGVSVEAWLDDETLPRQSAVEAIRQMFDGWVRLVASA